jgi:hypothetical protein
MRFREGERCRTATPTPARMHSKFHQPPTTPCLYLTSPAWCTSRSPARAPRALPTRPFAPAPLWSRQGALKITKTQGMRFQGYASRRPRHVRLRQPLAGPEALSDHQSAFLHFFWLQAVWLAHAQKESTCYWESKNVEMCFVISEGLAGPEMRVFAFYLHANSACESTLDKACLILEEI